MPRPRSPPTISEAMSVVSEVDRPRRAATRMKGVVAGMVTLKKMSVCLAPSTRAALMSVVSTPLMPW
ncbi:unknown [Collinsella sp. CAG:398]|nr:unknown [Collinsella sp. CAG:398]